MLLTLFLFAALAPSNVLTVDDDGPAQFADLASAVAAAVPGDVVLLAPGTYAALTVDKDIDLIAEVPGTVWIETPGQALVLNQSCHLFGLQIKRLELHNLAKRARIDACEVWNLSIQNCADVMVARTLVVGQKQHAVVLDGSAVEFVNSTIQAYFEPFLGFGYDAVHANGSSRVALIGTSVFGGDSLWIEDAGLVPPGAAVRVASGALDLVVRGSTKHQVQGGQTWDEKTSEALVAAGGSLTLTWSGVTLPTSQAPTVPAEPYFLIGPDSLDSPTRRVLGFGSAGSLMVVGVAPGSSTNLTTGLPGEALRLDLNHLIATVPLPLVGQDTPAAFVLVPPTGLSLVGLELDWQALVLDPQGELFGTNTAHLILRP
jgi:hypothetical protein